MMEVLRGGIESVDPGQMEAARSLGLNQWQAMVKVVFPQGVKNAIPALSNELVVNIKDSSVLSVIGVLDLMFATKTVVGIYFKQVELYVVAAVVYLCLTMVASWLLGKFAKHLSVEPAELLSTSDEAATVGTLAGTGSSKHSLESKKRRSVR
jgi:putative lysine transport system permease protein